MQSLPQSKKEGSGGKKKRKLEESFLEQPNHEKYSIGRTVNHLVVTLYCDSGDHTCGEHCIMNRIVESICCIPETFNTVC